MVDDLDRIDPPTLTTRTDPRTSVVLGRDEDAEQTGITTRAVVTGVGIAAEGIAALKVAGNELLDVADTLVFSTFDTVDDLAEQFTGPRLTSVAKAPTKIARAAYRAGSVSGRRVLTLA